MGIWIWYLMTKEGEDEQALNVLTLEILPSSDQDFEKVEG